MTTNTDAVPLTDDRAELEVAYQTYCGQSHSAQLNNHEAMALDFEAGWQARALLASKPAVHEGWKLVPVEPTRAMIEAARSHHEGELYLPHSLYCAMLAAALAVPAQSSAPFVVDQSDPLWPKHLYENMKAAHEVYEKNPPPTAPAQSCGEDEQADEAVTIKVDKDRFDRLMDALDRAERKGYMPDAIADHWSAFEWEIVPPAKDSK